MEKNIFEIVTELLKTVDKYIADDGKLLKATIYSDIVTMDKGLLSLLMSNNRIKSYFFKEVDNNLIFDKQAFAWFVTSKEFLPDSYTRYTNKIGLTNNGNYISKSNNVVLDFPYKDCVLVGGQDKEDQKRKEIFYNDIIANDQITKLLAPKVFTKSRRYSFNKVEDNVNFDERDNLIIKGNNLIVLYSLLQRYEGKIRCIYIDPPYNPKNTNSNTFGYNNTFNHSTWLTFMKNRLEVAKKLLIPNEGAMVIAIDENMQAYLGVLLAELFDDYETHMISVVHNPRGVQGTNFSYTNEFLYFVIPKGRKIIQNRKLSPDEITYEPLRNWGGESLRSDGKNCFYPILVKNDKIIGFGDVVDDNIHPNANEVIDGVLYIYPIDIEKVERKWRYARQSIDSVKDLLAVDTRKDGLKDIYLGKDFGQYKTVWIDKKFDANAYGKQWLNKIVDDKSFSYPKSIYAVKEAIYSIVAADKNAIILDFFGGSGTSAEAVSMINKDDSGNRKFIIVEQMDYIESITRERIVKSTIKDESKSVTYFELSENAKVLLDKINGATEDNIDRIKNEIYVNESIIPFVTRQELNDVDKIFKELTLDEKKVVLFRLVDKNKLYVNYSDMEDTTFNISKEDKNFTISFYEEH
jgi:methyltransferase